MVVGKVAHEWILASEWGLGVASHSRTLGHPGPRAGFRLQPPRAAQGLERTPGPKRQAACVGSCARPQAELTGAGSCRTPATLSSLGSQALTLEPGGLVAAQSSDRGARLAKEGQGTLKGHSSPSA